MWRSFFEGFKVPFKLYWDTAYENIMEVRFHSVQLLKDYWLQTTVFRWYWWFLVFWAIFPIWVWWKYADRNRFLEVSFFGVLVSILAGMLDTFGIYAQLWVYPYSLLPLMTNFFPIDYVVVPVVFLLIYQNTRAGSSF